LATADRAELLDAANHPHTANWHARMMARPAVAKTYTPSDEAPARPPTREPGQNAA